MGSSAATPTNHAMLNAQPPPGELPGLDLNRLRAHLDAERPGLAGGPLTGELVQGGRFNLTYVVGDGAHQWVVRRPQLGHVLATAHDMSREFRVLSALAGTPVPVPETHLLCQDESVLGARSTSWSTCRAPSTARRS